MKKRICFIVLIIATAIFFRISTETHWLTHFLILHSDTSHNDTALRHKPQRNSLFNFTECKWIFDTIGGHHFLSEMEVKQKLRFKYPTYLFSYAGSGNTVTRLLIEEITDIWTASPYFDRDLEKMGFLGEMSFFCEETNHIIAVKYHPEHMMHTKMRDIANLFRPCMGSKESYRHIQWQYVSAIFIVRDPWHAMFSVFQLKFSEHPKYKSAATTSKHVAHFELQDFDIAIFKQYVTSASNEWLMTFTLMDMMDKNNLTNYTVIRYENLVNIRSPLIAFTEMDKMTRFLFQDEYYQQNKLLLHIKMQCIIHQFMPMDYQRFGAVHRSKPDTTRYLSMEYAFKAVYDNDSYFLCHVWDRLKYRAQQYNFTLPQYISC